VERSGFLAFSRVILNHETDFLVIVESSGRSPTPSEKGKRMSDALGADYGSSPRLMSIWSQIAAFSVSASLYAANWASVPE
jgi:hypothetical protein